VAERLTRSEQQGRTRAALLDAAAHEFVQRGFQGATVEAIAERAGFTRGAFYSNFSSKDELFAELLQERVYTAYRAMAAAAAEADVQPTPRESGELLAAMQADPDGRWIFRLWLEVLAQAGRDDEMRRRAAGFWDRTRALTAQAITRAYSADGREPPVDADRLASAMIALDVGLALQHFVDPEGAPLDLYPELWEALFGTLFRSGSSGR
jgi:AcrR family transcriptional regulator